MIEHVLDWSDLVHEPEAVPQPDRELVGEVLDALERADECGRDRVVAENALGLTATVRAILAPHWRQRADGLCAGCPPAVAPAWPCPAWRAAHRWLVELDPTTGNRYEDEWYLMVERA